MHIISLNLIVCLPFLFCCQAIARTCKITQLHVPQAQDPTADLELVVPSCEMCRGRSKKHVLSSGSFNQGLLNKILNSFPYFPATTISRNSLFLKVCEMQKCTWLRWNSDEVGGCWHHIPFVINHLHKDQANILAIRNNTLSSHPINDSYSQRHWWASGSDNACLDHFAIYISASR